MMDISSAEDDRKQRFRFHKDDEILLLEIVLQAQPCPYKISARDGTILVAWNKIAEEFKNQCKPRPEGNLPHSRTCRTRCDKMIIDFLAIRASPHLRDKTKESKEEKIKNELLARLATVAGKIQDPTQGTPSGNPSSFLPSPAAASSTSLSISPSTGGTSPHGISPIPVGTLTGSSPTGSTSAAALTPGNVLAAAAAAAAVAGSNGVPSSGGLQDVQQHPHPLRGTTGASSYLVSNPPLGGSSGHDSLTSSLSAADGNHIIHNQGGNSSTVSPRQTRSHMPGGATSAIPAAPIGSGPGSSKRGSAHQYDYRTTTTPVPVAVAVTSAKRGSQSGTNNGTGKGEGHSAKRHRPSTGGKLPVSSASAAAAHAASSAAHNNRRHSSGTGHHSSNRSTRANKHGPPQGQSESEEDEEDGEEEEDENEEDDEDEDEDDVNEQANINHHTNMGQRAEPMMETSMNEDLDDYDNGYDNDYGNDLHDEGDSREELPSLIQSGNPKEQLSPRRMNRVAKSFISTLRPYSGQQPQSLETQSKSYSHSGRSSSSSLAQGSSNHRGSFGVEGGSSHNNSGGIGGAAGGFLGPSGKPLIVPSQVNAEDRVYLLRNLALEEQRVNVEVEKIALEREKLALERTRLQWEMRKANLQ
ncbi:hypothetical protein EMPS_02537 [Entomortierella parvispora]|uniref:Uncharacterized protein n=1 Tax=Entomortierella parvispora TaxID=205924 RepID=A0A9P3H515_9FUNG|nr:hypothetical protein EMPS_02537 [Entomortierella parvispora]